MHLLLAFPSVANGAKHLHRLCFSGQYWGGDGLHYSLWRYSTWREQPALPASGFFDRDVRTPPKLRIAVRNDSLTLHNRFIQSDSWWSLAMAVNVLLVFTNRANTRSIRTWGWLYCLVCYGGPFGIALICLLVTSEGKSLVYGNAGVSSLSAFISFQNC